MKGSWTPVVFPCYGKGQYRIFFVRVGNILKAKQRKFLIVILVAYCTVYPLCWINSHLKFASHLPPPTHTHTHTQTHTHTHTHIIIYAVFFCAYQSLFIGGGSSASVYSLLLQQIMGIITQHEMNHHLHSQQFLYTFCEHIFVFSFLVHQILSCPCNTYMTHSLLLNSQCTSCNLSSSMCPSQAGFL